MSKKTIIIALFFIFIFVCLIFGLLFAVFVISDSNSDSNNSEQTQKEFSADINIFFEVGTDDGYVLKIINLIEDIDYIEEVEFTSEAKAYKEYKDYLKQTNNVEILDVLESESIEKLPSSISIDLKDNSKKNKSDIVTLVKALDRKGYIIETKY